VIAVVGEDAVGREGPGDAAVEVADDLPLREEGLGGWCVGELEGPEDEAWSGEGGGHEAGS
jgi:hypothetical protein